MNWVYPRACGVCFKFRGWVIDSAGLSPRLRGLLQMAALGQAYTRGLSPRLRGLRALPAAQLGKARFIPAPAGSANSDPNKFAKTTVYPRACGVCCTVYCVTR